jgi:uncharacterized membrane protein YebE (DUF533 family)
MGKSAGQRRLDNYAGAEGGLGSLVSSMLGGQAGGGQRQGGSGGGLGDLLAQAQTMLRDNPAAAGGLGALAGMVMGRGRPVGGALGGAALGLLSMIAMRSLKAQSANRAAGAANQGGAVQIDPAEAASHMDENRASLAVEAMASAAKADGQIDPQELDKILGALESAGIEEDGRRWVLEEMRKPLDLPGLIAKVRDQETAAQVYAASLLAIQVDTPAEEDYLHRLASGLRLPDQVVASIRQQLGVRPAQGSGPVGGAPAA